MRGYLADYFRHLFCPEHECQSHHFQGRGYRDHETEQEGKDGVGRYLLLVGVAWRTEGVSRGIRTVLVMSNVPRSDGY